MASFAYAIEEDAVQRDLFVLDRPTRSRPKSGAKLILFVREEEEVMFTGTSVVKVAPEPGQAEHGSKYQVGEVIRFDDPRSLVELAGSLQRTRHFLEPWEDCKGWLLALSKQDFDTISGNAPAMARSIYRMLFHALPLPIQASFVQQHAKLFPTGRRITFGYDKLAGALIEFLEETLGESWTLFDQFIATYPADVEGMPKLAELWLTSGSANTSISAGAIRFGSDIQELHDILGRVVSSDTDRKLTLLHECREQLLSKSPDDWRRRWTDRIF